MPAYRQDNNAAFAAAVAKQWIRVVVAGHQDTLKGRLSYSMAVPATDPLRAKALLLAMMARRDLGAMQDGYGTPVPAHGSVLLKVTAQ